MNSSTNEMLIFCINYERKHYGHASHKCVIFVQSTKIGTHENKAIRSILFQFLGNTYTRLGCFLLFYSFKFKICYSLYKLCCQWGHLYCYKTSSFFKFSPNKNSHVYCIQIYHEPFQETHLHCSIFQEDKRRKPAGDSGTDRSSFVKHPSVHTVSLLRSGSASKGNSVTENRRIFSNV